MAHRNDLVRTPVTDRNGRATTVYRRPAETPGARAALPPVPSPQKQEPRWKAEFSVDALVAGLIAGDAPTPTDPVQEGFALLSDSDAFAYLSFGLPTEWGAAMHAAHPDPAHWADTAAVNKLRNKHLRTSEGVGPVDEAIAMMRSIGRTPEEVALMLQQGLCDRHLQGVLTAEQTALLFTEVNCLPAPFGDRRGTEEMVDCFTLGSLPIALVEEWTFNRETLKALARLLTDGQPTNPSDFGPAVKEDPSVAITMAKLIDRGDKTPHPEAMTWDAFKAYGEQDCARFGAKVLLRPTGVPGRLMGDVIREARTLGPIEDAVIEDALARGLPAEALLGIARGDALPVIADGLL